MARHTIYEVGAKVMCKYPLYRWRIMLVHPTLSGTEIIELESTSYVGVVAELTTLMKGSLQEWHVVAIIRDIAVEGKGNAEKSNVS